MKKVECGYDKCKYHRRHWCDPETPRGVQMVEVEDDHKGKAFCSLTCAIMAGYFSLKTGWKTPEGG